MESLVKVLRGHWFLNQQLDKIRIVCGFGVPRNFRKFYKKTTFVAFVVK